jgi:hypothetical protein
VSFSHRLRNECLLRQLLLLEPGWYIALVGCIVPLLHELLHVLLLRVLYIKW